MSTPQRRQGNISGLLVFQIKKTVKRHILCDNWVIVRTFRPFWSSETTKNMHTRAHTHTNTLHFTTKATCIQVG